MDKDFESELKGTAIQAENAKQQIAKYFKRYGTSGHQEAKKHQLIFASKMICIISKCESKHLDIYCNIINDVFSDRLYPEASDKYWTLYVNCMRYFHYSLVEKKDFEKASLVYRHISSYKNKLQNSENALTCINIYCYQLFLQNSLRSKNQDLALSEATGVIENLTTLFSEILDTNAKQSFQYPDVLQKTFAWLFPQNKTGTVYQFLKTLPATKVKRMFQALFTLYGHHTLDPTYNEGDVQEHAKFVLESVYTLLQMDIMDKMQLQLSIELMSHCHTESRLKSCKPIAEAFRLLYDYLKLLCAQESTLDFQRNYRLYCERFKHLFNRYSKNVMMHQAWFGDFLILIFYLHSQLQNQSVFSCFWQQMTQPECFQLMFEFFVELMKIAPCITAESKLFTINCCTSIRKHVILSFAQIALASFVFYCQNVTEESEKHDKNENCVNNLSDCYKETIQNNFILVINHAFKIIDKMDCITSSSQEIEILLTRFKQVTLSCKTNTQAGTCILLCEHFLKIKKKIAGKEWPLLLRRLYKTVTQLMSDTPRIGRELQMCYITSMLHETLSHIDINQIRTQIGIFYANESTSTNRNEPSQQQEEHCLMDLYYTTNSLLRPHLETSRKKLLHWLESQYVLKYCKTNTPLLHSILKFSQSHYDFILITKLGKLQTYAMAKITSLYKNLNLKLKSSVQLNRLEELIFAHVCVMLLNDMSAVQKFQIDSKDLFEEQLENLLLREEMSTITIYNDLKRFKLAWKAFKAFEGFYEKFDNEIIPMDDAIIDWESILDDLANLALYFQLSGYMEQTSQAWLLHYKCSRLIQDNISALRGLAFFCEYSEQFDEKSFQLEEEIQNNFPSITHELENLANLQRQAYQTYVLLVVLQIAHYYARSSRLSFAQMLLQYVQLKHGELNERQGRYDIVLATMDTIKFRLLWKHFQDTKATREAKTAANTTAENLLLHRCLLHEAEEALDRFHEFSCISSCDGLLYSILIINLVQELAECTVNRLCDNFINSLFVATCKCTLSMGLAVRFVQVMSMWMWVNLQMEYVDRAQVKLKIIEFVTGMKGLKELVKSSKTFSDKKPVILLPTACAELSTPNQQNPGMEAIRKLAPVQLSPIKTDKLQLSPSHRNSDLKRYFKCNIDTNFVSLNDQIEWIYFMVGCLNARLYYLVEDFDQLESFYESGTKWLEMRQNSFNKKHFNNIQLMAMQHYANFLRARRQYDKALKCLAYGMELCENKKFYIDAAYSVNFRLQLVATQKEMNTNAYMRFKVPTHSKLRRALEFNISPEIKQQKTPAKKVLKENMLQNTNVSAKTPSALKNNALRIESSACSSSKKLRTQAGSKSRLAHFEICEDILEIVEIKDNDIELISTKDDISVKRTKLATPRTPATIRKPVKSAKTTGIKSYAKTKRPEIIPQFNIDNLSTSSSSSPESLETEENLNTNAFIAQMQSLEINGTEKTKLKTEIAIKGARNRTKAIPSKDPATVIIVLDDSPGSVKPQPTEIVDKPKSSRTRAHSKDRATCKDSLATRSTRRQRKLPLESKNQPNLENASTSTFLAIATPVATRRRQKNLV